MGRNRADAGGDSNKGLDRGAGGQEEEVEGRAGGLRRRAGGRGERGRAVGETSGRRSGAGDCDERTAAAAATETSEHVRAEAGQH